MISKLPWDELDELANAQCEGVLTDEQVVQLEALVTNDSELRRYYILYLQMHALVERGRGMRDDGMAFQDSTPEGSGHSKSPTLASSVVTNLRASPTVDVSTSAALPSFVYNYFSSGWPVAYLITTVIFAIGAIVGALTHVSWPVQVAHESQYPVNESVSPGRIVERVGQITAMVNCKWSNPEAASVAKIVCLHQTYALDSGLVEIIYDSGAKVILQGPAVYQVDSVAGGFLSVGRVTARVEKRGEEVASGQWLVASNGNQPSTINNQQSPNLSLATSHQPLFTITTPTATITDLGTEFGVEVDEKGVTETQVFVGSVEVTSLGCGNGRVKGQVIYAGGAVCVDGNGNHTMVVPPSANRFVRSLPSDGQAQRFDEEYAKLVLSLDPVVYYRMEEWPKTKNNGCYTLVDSSAGHYDGELHLDYTFGPPAGAGKFGQGLHFLGPMVGNYAIVSDYPKAKNGQLTVSAWVNAGAFFEPYSSIVANFAGVRPCPGQFFLGTDDKSNLLAQIRAHNEAVINIVDRPLPRRQWQHVAIVADGSVMHLYRNGVEVGSAECHGITRKNDFAALGVGCQADLVGPEAKKHNARAWVGYIDELAIFNHALTVEQVRQLYAGSVPVSVKKIKEQTETETSEEQIHQ